jgi:hypothetical protein
MLVQLGHLQLKAAGRAVECLLQSDEDLGSLVPAARTKARACSPLGETSHVPTLSEQGFEEIAKPVRLCSCKACTTEPEMSFPPRWRPDLVT